jgi:hypothetical protein
MRSKQALGTAVATLMIFAAGSSWAAKGGKAKAKDDGAMPDNISKQFEWEEKVVGPNDDKKIDHKKIAAMQAAARKDEANHKNEPSAKKPARARGVDAPSTSTIPTQDIEKPTVSASKPARSKPMAAEKETRQRDSLDNLLDSEKETGGAHAGNDNPLGKMLAVDDKPASSSRGSTATKTKSKHARRARQ